MLPNTIDAYTVDNFNQNFAELSRALAVQFSSERNQCLSHYTIAVHNITLEEIEYYTVANMSTNKASALDRVTAWLVKDNSTDTWAPSFIMHLTIRCVHQSIPLV